MGVDPLLLQKAVGSRPSTESSWESFYRKQLGVDPHTSTESSSSRPSHFYRKQLGVDSLTQKAVGSRHRKQLGVDTLNLLLRQKVVGSRHLILLQKAVGSRPSTTSTESSWESNLHYFDRKQLGVDFDRKQLGVDPPTLQKASTESSSSRPSHFYRKQLGVDSLTTESSWESSHSILQKAVGSRHSYF